MLVSNESLKNELILLRDEIDAAVSLLLLAE